MKDDDEGGCEGGDEGGGEGSDEGVMKMILSCLRGFASWQTDRQTNGQTLVNVESLLRLKILFTK